MLQNHVSHFYSGVCFRAMFTLVVQSVDFREQRWSGYFILTWSSVPVFCQLSFGSKRHTSQGFEVSCPCSEVDLNNIWFNAESTHFPWLSAIIILVIIIFIIILCRIWTCMQVFDVLTGLLCRHCVQWYWLNLRKSYMFCGRHRRNQNYLDILNGLNLGQRGVFGITHQFHHVFWFGDLNYRIDLDVEVSLRNQLFFYY